jgi:hypothetical protein
MSNVLQKAFYLNRCEEPECAERLTRDRARRWRHGCGAARRQTTGLAASSAVFAEWRPPSLVAFYQAVATRHTNVSSAAAKPAPLLRPSQTVGDERDIKLRQQT